MSTATDTAESLVRNAQSGVVIAHQVGILYPGFEGAPRTELSEIFLRHGFPGASTRVLDIDAARAMTQVAGNVGSRRKDGLRLDSLKPGEGHSAAWGVYRVSAVEDERSSRFVIGARIYVEKGVLHAASPVEGQTDDACLEFARKLIGEAVWLTANADTATVSTCIGRAIGEAGALAFISRGAYVLREGPDATSRLLACLAELRSRFYSEETRKGLRCTAIAITERDAKALSDSVIDDAEERVREMVEQLRQEAGSATVRPATLSRRRKECADLLAGLGPVRALLGDFAARLEQAVLQVQTAYNSADAAVDIKFPEFEGASPAAQPEAQPEAAPSSAPATHAAPAPVAAPAPEATEDFFSI